MLVRWLVFIHVLSATSFFLFHGASASMAFKVRTETELARIRALLDLSQSSFVGVGVSFVVMGLTGIVMPFLIHIWDRAYIWVSIVLMVGVVVHMALRSEYYNRLRVLVGLPYRIGGKSFPAEPPAPQEEITSWLRKSSVTGIAISGYLVPAVVLWLMIFKPF